MGKYTPNGLKNIANSLEAIAKQLNDIKINRLKLEDDIKNIDDIKDITTKNTLLDLLTTQKELANKAISNLQETQLQKNIELKNADELFNKNVANDITPDTIGYYKNSPDIDNAKLTKTIGNNDDLANKVITTKGNTKELNNITGEAIETATKTNTKLFNKLRDFVAKNPLKTMAALVAAALGTYGLANALKSYLSANGQILNITCSFPENDDLTSYFSCPNNSSNSINSRNSINSSISPEDIVIRFSPSIKIVEGDKIKFSSTSFDPNFDDESIEIKSIVSPSCIIITRPDITTFTNTGTFTLETSFIDRIVDEIENAIDVVEDVGETLYDTIDNALGGTLTIIKDLFNKYSKLFGILCGILCCFILIFFIIQLRKL